MLFFSFCGLPFDMEKPKLLEDKQMRKGISYSTLYVSKNIKMQQLLQITA